SVRRPSPIPGKNKTRFGVPPDRGALLRRLVACGGAHGPDHRAKSSLNPLAQSRRPRPVRSSRQRWPLRQRRILIAGFPRLMTDILEHAVAKDPELAVAGMIDDANLAAAARRTRADVLV